MFGNLFVQHDEIFSPSQDGDLYLPGIQRKNGKLSSARVDSIILGAPGQLTGKGLGWSPRKFYLHCKTPLEEKNELSEKRKNNNNNN